MPNARINGVDLYYELTGEAGSPLVLVHGSWGDHHTWNAVSPSLGRSFRVLTYDRRGHSQSERQPGQGRIQEDATNWPWRQAQTLRDGSTVWSAQYGEPLLLLAVVDGEGAVRDVYGWRNADEVWGVTSRKLVSQCTILINC